MWLRWIDVSLCCLLALTAQAQVNYIERSWDAGKKQVVSQTKTCTTYKELTGEELTRETFGPGWYVVKGKFSRFQAIFNGEVHLILTDGCKMTAKGIVTEADSKSKFHIYSQSDGDQQGKLEVSNDYFDLNAGLGARESRNIGSLYIHGGDIRVIQDKSAVAIGGGDTGQIDPKSEVVVYGGKVYAKSGSYGAAIGGGYRKNQGGPVTVYGGTVEAVAGRDGAAIGGGRSGDGGRVNVYGGKVTARGANAVYNGSNSVAGAGIGGGMLANGGDVHVYGGEVYAYGGHGASGIGGSYSANGGTLEVSGGVVYASSNDKDQWLAPAIGGGMSGNDVKVTVNGGVLMAVTRQSSSLHPAPIGPGSYDGGHLYYSNTEIRLADNMKVSYSTHQDAIKDAQYRQGQYLQAVNVARREDVCQDHATTFVRIEGCSHGSYTYTMKDNEKHMRQCGFCNDKAEEAHTYSNGKCICGNAEEVTDYWTVTCYYTTDGKTYATGDEYQVVKGLQTTLPIAPKFDGLTFMGYVQPSGAAPASIEMTDSEQKDKQLIAAGASVEPTKNTAYYARYRYNYTEKWEWNSDCTEASVTLTNSLAGDPVKVTATITEDEQRRVEPTEDKLGEAYYTATATYKKSDGVTYRFEDHQKVTLRQPRIIILDAFDTEGKNAELLEQYDGFEAEVVINNLTLKKDGKIHPICLPFDITNLNGTPLEGAWIYRFMGFTMGSNLRISFTGSSTIEAGKPYFYQFTNGGDDISHPVFSPVIIGDSDGSGKYETDFDLLGTYEIMAFDDEMRNQTVVFDDSKIIHAPETVNAFGSYFYIVPNIDADGERAVNAITLEFSNSGLEFGKKLFDSWAGQGTQASPYIIRNAPQLKELQEAFAASDAARLKGKYFRQTANLSFDKNVDNNYKPITSFTAHYDGAGHVISGLNITSTDDGSAALFETLEGQATVRNVIIAGSTFKGQYSAPIANIVRDGSLVENCHVLRDVVVESANSAGGIVTNLSDAAAKVTGCTSHATLKGNAGIGGIVGFLNAGTLSNSIFLGNSITANNDTHAVVGSRTAGTVEDCYFTAPALSDALAKLMPMEQVDNTAFITLLSTRDKYLLQSDNGLTEEQIGYDITVNGRKLSAKQQADGTWKSVAYPICWPFTVNILEQYGDIEDIKVYTAHLVDLENKVLQFTNDLPIVEAGKPYVIVISKGSYTLTGKNVTIVSEPQAPEAVYSSADKDKQIGWWKGTFKKIEHDNAVADNAHIIQNDGMFKRIVNRYPNVYVNPFRGYFSTLETLTFEDFYTKYVHTEDGLAEGDVTDFPSDEFDADFNMDDETGVNEVRGQKEEVRGDFYNLAGQRVAQPTKGLYIQNGKKIVIK